jgi:class 3 adenylate cyclase
MATTTATRRLAAILAAHVVGYSRLMGADEEGTHERFKAHLRDLVEPKIREHHGRTIKTIGDGMLTRDQRPGFVPLKGLSARVGEAMRRTSTIADVSTGATAAAGA